MSKSNRNGQSECLSLIQVEEFLSNLPVKYSLLAEVMYFSAGRVRECTTIKVRNINFKTQLLTLEKSSTKTKESRQVPLHPSTLEKLQAWITSNNLESDDFIFFTSSRNTNYKIGEKPVSIQSVDGFFRKTFDWIGIQGASTHSFRRSRLTHLMEKSWNMREIMDISGHKSLISLQKYLNTDKADTFEKYKRLFDKELV